MRRISIIFSLIGLISLFLLRGELLAVTITPKDINNDGKEEVVLENNLFRLTISPHFGGQGISLYLKDEKRELVPNDGLSGGLFIDHDTKVPWPGEFFHATYSYEIKKSSLILSHKARGKWQGKEYPDLKDLLIKRTITIYENSPVIDVFIEITNQGDKGKLLDYWVQNIVSGAGNPANDLYFRPTPEGISEGKATKKEFIYTPAAGWMAVCDPTKKLGIAFIMDYNYLKTLYNCIPFFTNEWMYDRVAIPKGATWKTDYKLILTKGLPAVSYASDNIIANIELSDSTIEYSLQASSRPLSNLNLKIQVLNKGMGGETKYRFETSLGKLVPIEEAPPKEELSVTKKIETLSFKAITDSIRLPSAQPGLRIVKVEVKGKDFWEVFEKPFPIGDTKAVYSKRLPEKEKVFLKPKDIKLIKDEKIDIFYTYEALFQKRWKIEEIVKLLDQKATIKPSTISYTPWKGSCELSYFPSSYEEMLSYDLIIMQAQDSKALGAIGQEMIKDYVQAGGGLLLLGGYYSFGKSRPADGRILREIFPVELDGPWDLVEAKNTRVKKAKSHAITEGLSFSGEPNILWYHSVKAKKNSKVILTIDDNKPLLVIGEYGKGRVVAFTGTILGIPSNKQSPTLTEWSDYNKFILNICRWLLKRK